MVLPASTPTGKNADRKLARDGPPQNGGWFYYSPDGHAIGPFDYKEEMEADIKKHYKES